MDISQNLTLAVASQFMQYVAYIDRVTLNDSPQIVMRFPNDWGLSIVQDQQTHDYNVALADFSGVDNLHDWSISSHMDDQPLPNMRRTFSYGCMDGLTNPQVFHLMNFVINL